ncbi:MAG: DUF3422 family protein [Gammaproteobacteria bacterium]
MGKRHLGHLADNSSVAAAHGDGVAVRLAVPDWRNALYEELHARPFPVLSTPLRVSHLAVLPATDMPVGTEDLEHLRTLCVRFSQQPPGDIESCFYRDFGDFELRWEKHTEFCTWTILRKGSDARPVENTALSVLPGDWLAALPGRIVAAVHVVVQARPEPMVSRDELRAHFEGHRLIGSLIYDGRGEVWTAFRLHSDGFGRFLVFHDDLNPCETGRLVQQLLEVETYRLMALLSLPLVRDVQPELSAMDVDLAALVAGMSEDGDERSLLDRLSGHASQLEQLRARLSYRLAATRAYYALVMKRLEQLRIGEMRGLQTITYFLDRRLTPAVRTCEAASTRLDELSMRIDRAAELIRTRVDLSIEEQNQSLLASMERRSGMQLRLQQAVEGLSVAAITYYVVQLVHAVAEGLPHLGVAADAEIVTAVSVPFVLVTVVALVVRLRRRVNL